jgi:hypothetical protein
VVGRLVNAVSDGPWWAYALVGAVLVAACFILAYKQGRSFQLSAKDGLKVGEKPAGTVPAELPSEGKPVSRSDDRALWKRYPVGIDHEDLLAAESTIQAIVRSVTSETSSWALTVSGEGGLGKTALTYEAVERLAASDRFTRAVWASARTATFQTDVAAGNTATLDWQEVVRVIAEQLGCQRTGRRLWEHELEKHMSSLDAAERILLVVDNLEGINDADRVIVRLSNLGFAAPHKVVATTRWSVQQNDYDIPDIPVSPLTEYDSLRLIRVIGHADSELQSVDDGQLRPVFAITEGNPFLIKLIVRRYLAAGQPLEQVMTELTSLRGADTGPLPLSNRVRRYLYDSSLNELATRFDRTAVENLMASFCFAARGETVSYDDLYSHSSMTDNVAFADLIETAHRLALIRPTELHRRYSIHSLLYEYVCTGS